MSMNVNGAANTNAYQQMQKASAAGNTAGGYDQSAYLKALNKKVNAPVLAGAWNGSSIGSGQPTVMIHPAMLEKMHGDPETAAYYEEQINAYAQAASQSKARFESQGHEITSMGMYINENGEMSGFMSGRTAGTEKTAKTEKKRTAKDLMKELQEKLEEKREKEKLEEKRKADTMLLESLQASGTVTASSVSPAPESGDAGAEPAVQP